MFSQREFLSKPFSYTLQKQTLPTSTWDFPVSFNSVKTLLDRFHTAQMWRFKEEILVFHKMKTNIFNRGERRVVLDSTPCFSHWTAQNRFSWTICACVPGNYNSLSLKAFLFITSCDFFSELSFKLDRASIAIPKKCMLRASKANTIVNICWLFIA